MKYTFEYDGKKYSTNSDSVETATELIRKLYKINITKENICQQKPDKIYFNKNEQPVWTKEEEDTLKGLLKNSISLKEISNTIGKKESTIKNKIKQLGLDKLFLESLSNEEEKLLNQLVNLRRFIANKYNLQNKPYLIFKKQTLIAIAKNKPTTKEELKKLKYVTQSSIDLYGDQFLQLMTNKTQNNQWANWTNKEEEKLVNEFKIHKTIFELSQEFKRSEESIRHKLEQLGQKIDEEKELDSIQKKFLNQKFDSNLYTELLALRQTISKKDKVPPYEIFSNETLYQISINPPKNLEELQQIPGVTETKLKKYGSKFLDAILYYQKMR